MPVFCLVVKLTVKPAAVSCARASSTFFPTTDGTWVFDDPRMYAGDAGRKKVSG